MLHIIILFLFTCPFTMGLGTLQGSNSIAINNISKPNCPTHCGNITVPYPFGIGNDTGCSIDNSFHVTCDTSFDPPKLFLRSSDIEIYNISDSELRIHMSPAYRCYSQDGTINSEFDWWIQLSTFTFSQKNMFTVIGCDDYSLIRGRQFSSGCLGVCSIDQNLTNNGQCTGLGCCQTSIPKGLDYYDITLQSFQNHMNVSSLNRCGFAFLGEKDSFVFGGASDLFNSTDVRLRIKSTVPVVVDWVIASETQGCPESPACKENSSCYEVDGGGYHCRCNDGFEAFRKQCIHHDKGKVAKHDKASTLVTQEKQHLAISLFRNGIKKHNTRKLKELQRL